MDARLAALHTPKEGLTGDGVLAEAAVWELCKALREWSENWRLRRQASLEADLDFDIFFQWERDWIDTQDRRVESALRWARQVTEQRRTELQWLDRAERAVIPSVCGRRPDDD